jgi:hypothetical protein
LRRRTISTAARASDGASAMPADLTRIPCGGRAASADAMRVTRAAGVSGSSTGCGTGAGAGAGLAAVVVEMTGAAGVGIALRMPRTSSAIQNSSASTAIWYSVVHTVFRRSSGSAGLDVGGLRGGISSSCHSRGGGAGRGAGAGRARRARRSLAFLKPPTMSSAAASTMSSMVRGISASRSGASRSVRMYW